MIQKPSQVEWILLLLFVANLLMTVYNGCNTSAISEHTKSEFARMDSIQKEQLAITDSILQTVDNYGNFMDSVKSHRTVTIPKKYAPKKAAVVNLPDDSLQNEFRSVFGQPSH